LICVATLIPFVRFVILGGGVDDASLAPRSSPSRRLPLLARAATSPRRRRVDLDVDVPLVVIARATPARDARDALDGAKTSSDISRVARRRVGVAVASEGANVWRRPHTRARHDDADGDDEGGGDAREREREVERRAEFDVRRDRAEPDRGRRRGGSVRASDREAARRRLDGTHLARRRRARRARARARRPRGR
jgi:hypothetical protein